MSCFTQNNNNKKQEKDHNANGQKPRICLVISLGDTLKSQLATPEVKQLARELFGEKAQRVALSHNLRCIPLCLSGRAHVESSPHAHLSCQRGFKCTEILFFARVKRNRKSQFGC